MFKDPLSSVLTYTMYLNDSELTLMANTKTEFVFCIRLVSFRVILCCSDVFLLTVPIRDQPVTAAVTYEWVQQALSRPAGRAGGILRGDKQQHRFIRFFSCKNNIYLKLCSVEIYGDHKLVQSVK